MENKKYNDPLNWVNDSEFIKGNVQESYPVFSLSKEQLKDGKFHPFPKDFSSHYIEITREDTGESRIYAPLSYAELHLENFIESVESSENYNEKMLTLNNAKLHINKLVYTVTKNDKHNLSLGNCTDKSDSHNFSNIFERINNAMEYLRVNREFETIKPTQSLQGKTVNKKKPTPRQLAFYVYFLIESKLIEPFKPLQKNKQAQEICDDNGGVDLTNFQKNFNLINSNKDKNRAKGTAHNITALKFVCEMLKDKPDALKLAKAVLKEADKG